MNLGLSAVWVVVLSLTCDRTGPVARTERPSSAERPALSWQSMWCFSV